MILLYFIGLNQFNFVTSKRKILINQNIYFEAFSFQNPKHWYEWTNNALRCFNRLICTITINMHSKKAFSSVSYSDALVYNFDWVLSQRMVFFTEKHYCNHSPWMCFSATWHGQDVHCSKFHKAFFVLKNFFSECQAAELWCVFKPHRETSREL